MTGFEAVLFWLAKPLVEIVLVLALVIVVLCVYWVATLPMRLKQRRCKHERVREDQACNAWCQDCGKNLGFIANWRRK